MPKPADPAEHAPAQPLPDPHPADPTVEIIDRTVAFQGHFRIERWHVRHRAFDGGLAGPATREVFERGHAVAVLPYDPVTDQVVLIAQFRVGAMAAGWPAWLLEIPAGIVDPGETATAVAHREVAEETGCRVTALQPIAQVLLTPGGSSETCSLFCGRVAAADAAGLAGLAHEHEDIRVDVVPASAVLGGLHGGAFRNAVALMAVQWFALNHTTLRRRWLDAPDPERAR